MKGTPIGTRSGYHEQRTLGITRGSKIWDGENWVSNEDYNQRYEKGEFLIGGQFLKKTKETALQAIGTVNQTIDNLWERVPGVVREPAEELNEAQNQLALNAFTTGYSLVGKSYNALPEPGQDFIKGVGSSAAWALNQAEQANLNWSHALGTTPLLTEGIFTAAEFALTAGTSTIARKGGSKLLQEVLTSKQVLQPAYVANRVVDGSGLVRQGDDLAKTFFEASSVRGGHQKRGTHWLSDLEKGTAKRFDEMGVGRRAATHHIADVSPVGRAVEIHPQGNRILDKLRLEFNLPTGEDVANFVTAYDTINMKAYSAKLSKIKQAFPELDDRTIKDLLKVLPWEDVGKQRLTQKQLNQLIKETGRKDLAKDLTRVNFPDMTLEPTLPKVYTDRTKKVVKHEFKDLDEWKKRWSILTGDPNADAQVRAIIRSVDNDPSLNIFSLDHMRGFHENYEKLESVKILNAAINDGSFATMNVDKATTLLKNSITDKRKIVTNYLDIKLQALDKKFPGFKQLSLEDQSKFMLDNANEVAKVLNWFEQPGIDRLLQDVSLKKLGPKKAARLKELFGLQDLPDPTNQIRFKVPNKPL